MFDPIAFLFIDMTNSKQLSVFVSFLFMTIGLGDEYIVDQQYTNGWTDIPVVNAGQFGKYGQSFSPTLGAIDFVQLRVSDGTPGNSLAPTLYVEVRANGTTGDLLGVSEPAVARANTYGANVTFVFRDRLRLTPNAEYVIVPRLTEFTTVPGTQELARNDDAFVYSGDSSGANPHYIGNRWPLVGYVVEENTVWSTRHMWFREGIAVPEPSIVALALSGAIGLMLMRPTLRTRKGVETSR